MSSPRASSKKVFAMPRLQLVMGKWSKSLQRFRASFKHLQSDKVNHQASDTPEAERSIHSPEDLLVHTSFQVEESDNTIEPLTAERASSVSPPGQTRKVGQQIEETKLVAAYDSEVVDQAGLNSNHPEEIERTQESELKEMWQETMERVREIVNDKTFGEVPNEDWATRLVAVEGKVKHSELPLPAEMIQRLRGPDDPDEDTKSTWEKTKRYSQHVLECIKGLGGVGAKAGSEVFPSSEICFSAFCYLIDTVQKYHQYFNSLNDLLEDIIPFLHRFHLHAKPKSRQYRLDPGLKEIIEKILDNFVWVCCHATKLMRAKAWDKTKIAVQILLFRSDGNVSERIYQIKQLVSYELQQGVAIIQNSVQVTEKNVEIVIQKLEAQQANRERAETSRKHLTSIEDSLGIREQKRYRDHEHCPTDWVKEMGSWLIKHESFCSWSSRGGDNRNIPKPILVLEAPPHYGKTYLCSQVIRHLRKDRSGTSSTKADVAYFHFDKSGKNQNATTLEALRYIIWQLCDSDISYRKFAAGVCEKYGELPATDTLWTEAIEAYQKPATFFIILDGVEKAVNDRNELEQIVKRVAQHSGKVQLRLLMAAPKHALDMLRGPSDDSIATIKVSDYNDDDVSRFVRSELDKSNKIKTWSHDLKERIHAVLSEFPGDLTELRSIILQFESNDSRDVVENFLQESLKNYNENYGRLKRTIDKLEKTLDDESIKDLNEIIPWIILPWVWPTLRQVNAVLDLRRGMRSVMTIEDRIRTKYPEPLLEIDGDDVLSVDTVEYFGKLAATKEYSDTSDASNPAVQGEGRLHPSVVDTVKDLVRAAVGVEQYQRHGIDELISNRLNQYVSRVTYQEVDGHGRIIVSCLKSFCTTKHKESAEALHEYAVDYLGWHLCQIDSEGLPKLSNLMKNSIGDLFHRFLTQDEPLRAWLKLVVSKRLASNDDNTDDIFNTILKWFEDPEVLKGVPDDVKSFYPPDDAQPLIKKATELVTQEWLQKEEWNASNACAWLVRHVSKKGSETDTDSKSLELGNDDTVTISAQDIWDAERHAHGLLKDSATTTCYLTRLSETFLAFGHYKEAIKVSKTAKKSQPKDCKVILSLSRAQRLDWPEDAYETLRELYDDDLGVDKKWPIWKNILLELGDLSEELGNIAFAVEVSQKLLKQYPSDADFGLSFVRRAIHDKRYDIVLQYLKQNGEKGERTGKTRLQELLSKFADSSVLHYQVSLAATKANQESSQQRQNLEFVVRCYELAEKDLQQNSYVLVHLRYYHGLALQYQLDKIDDAIKLWDENINTKLGEDEEGLQEWITFKSARKLSAAYLRTWKIQRLQDVKLSPDSYIANIRTVQNTGPRDDLPRHNLLIARVCKDAQNENGVLESLKPHMERAKSLLSDEDPHNDWLGYYTLAEALSFVDNGDALAAWSLITPREVDGPSTDELAFYSYGPLYNSCDGDCGHYWTYPDNMYVCKDCIDVQLDRKCYDKLMNGTLEPRVCGSDHEFLHVPPWDVNEVNKKKKSEVMLADGAKDIRVWLEKIWKKYYRDEISPD